MFSYPDKTGQENNSSTKKKKKEKKKERKKESLSSHCFSSVEVKCTVSVTGSVGLVSFCTELDKGDFPENLQIVCLCHNR